MVGSIDFFFFPHQYQSHFQIMSSLVLEDFCEIRDILCIVLDFDVFLQRIIIVLICLLSN